MKLNISEEEIVSKVEEAGALGIITEPLKYFECLGDVCSECPCDTICTMLSTDFGNRDYTDRDYDVFLNNFDEYIRHTLEDNLR